MGRGDEGIAPYRNAGRPQRVGATLVVARPAARTCRGGCPHAFMGQQYHLEVGGKDFYIDLLFYNTKLRCYVAIDLKTGEFKPEQAGKMNFYLSALDDLVKAPEDNPSVGLILCRDENRTIAEYALRDMSKPIGVSEYHLCTDLPLDLKNALPAVEDIRSRIDMKK